jgi:hypothetical protein
LFPGETADTITADHYLNLKPHAFAMPDVTIRHVQGVSYFSASRSLTRLSSTERSQLTRRLHDAYTAAETVSIAVPSNRARTIETEMIEDGSDRPDDLSFDEDGQYWMPWDAEVCIQAALSELEQRLRPPLRSTPRFMHIQST